MKRPSVFLRFFALTVDMAILSLLILLALVSVMAGYLAGSEEPTFSALLQVLFLFSILALLLFLFYFTFLNMGGGTTPGKHLFGLKVINGSGMGSGMELGFLRALVRSAGYTISFSTLGIGFFIAVLFNGTTLHDFLAGTRVIEEDA